MNVTLRHTINAADRDAIAAITRSSGFFTEMEVALALEVFDEALAKPSGSYRYILAEAEGETLGYACYGKDEQTVSSYELYWIAVDDRWRGTGIGHRLLEAVENAIRALGPAQLFIETAGREQYLPTRKFYEHKGYKEVAWLDDYFAPGDARVIFAKWL